MPCDSNAGCSYLFHHGNKRDCACSLLYDLEIKAAYILNDYVTAPNKELLRMVLGPELMGDAGKSVIMVRVLYRLKRTDALFRAHLAHCMQESWYESCNADLNL